MIHRLRRLWPLGFMLLLLSGCGTNATIGAAGERSGIWDTYFVGPLSDVLDWFARILWNEYGLSVLVVTIIIRFLILPLTLKQYKSSKQMQDIQPELAKLKQKFKDDPKKQQEETMKLFQQHNVNPMAGCLPVFVQMPILIALYNAIMRNPEIFHDNFLWLQLGEKDPYYILPTIAAITTFLQTKVTASATPANPQMKTMMMIFPIMIFVMSLQFASALPLYWVYSNIFTIIQSYFIYRPAKKK